MHAAVTGDRGDRGDRGGRGGSGGDTGDARVPGAPDEPALHGPALLDCGRGVRIPDAELRLRATTGSGPGGQHVNRSATRVELRWNPGASEALRDALDASHRERVLRRLARRTDAAGDVRIVAGEYRSQHRNRAAALARLRALVADALPDPVPRRATKPTRASVERRLDAKRRRGATKRERRRPPDE